VVVGIPLGNLLWKAGVQVSLTPEGRVREWSAMHCFEMLLGRVIGSDGVSRFPYWRYMSWSLRIAVLATATAVLVAIPLAWQARRGGWRAIPMLLVLEHFARCR
jgi:ABC-type spermidine/putrescine transport system permease subunit I